MKLTPQPAADEGADDADDEIADEAEAAAAHQLAGEPARDQTDDQENEQAFSAHDLNLPATRTPQRRPGCATPGDDIVRATACQEAAAQRRAYLRVSLGFRCSGLSPARIPGRSGNNRNCARFCCIAT